MSSTPQGKRAEQVRLLAELYRKKTSPTKIRYEDEPEES
jgi:hypothetical protein